MIITKQVEGFGTVWYDDNNADMENMFKGGHMSAFYDSNLKEPLKSAAIEDQEEEEESAYITLKRAMFGDIK